MAFPWIGLPYAGATSNAAGDVDWTNSGQVVNSVGAPLAGGADTNNTHVTLTPGQTSYWLKCTDFRPDAGWGLCHADSVLDGVNLLVTITQDGDDASENTSLEILEYALVKTDGTLDTPVACSGFTLTKAANADVACRTYVLGSRSATTGLPNWLPNSLTYSDFCNTNSGIAFRVKNSHGSLTSKVIVTGVAAEIATHTAAVSAVITKSSDTGNLMAPCYLMVSALGSKFGSIKWPYTCRWTFYKPDGTVGEHLVDDPRPPMESAGVQWNMATDINRCSAVMFVEEEDYGTWTIKLEILDDDGAVAATTTTTEAVAANTRTTYTVNTGGGADYTSFKAAIDALTGADNWILELTRGQTFDYASATALLTGSNNCVIRAKAGVGRVTLSHDGGSNTYFLNLDTCDRFLFDGRDMDWEDPDNGDVTKYFITTVGGCDYLGIFGLTLTSGMSQLFVSAGGAAAQGLWIGDIIDSDRTGLKSYGCYAYDYYDMALTGVRLAARTNHSGGGFFRAALDSTGANQALARGVLFWCCEVDCATNDNSWGVRAMTSHVEAQYCYWNGEFADQNQTDAGNPYRPFWYWHDWRQCHYRYTRGNSAHYLPAGVYTAVMGWVIDGAGRLLTLYTSGSTYIQTLVRGNTAECAPGANEAIGFDYAASAAYPWTLDKQLAYDGNSHTPNASANAAHIHVEDGSTFYLAAGGNPLVLSCQGNRWEQRGSKYAYQDGATGGGSWRSLASFNTQIGATTSNVEDTADYTHFDSFGYPSATATASRTDVGIALSSLHDYRGALRSQHASSSGNVWNAASQPNPLRPRNVTATLSGTTITVDADAAIATVETVTGYKIYLDGVLAATVASLPANITGNADGGEVVTVYAYQTVGGADYWSEDSIPVTTIATPTNLNVTNHPTALPVTVNLSALADSVNVYVAATAGGSRVLVKNVSPASESFTIGLT